MHLYRLGELTLYLTDIPFIRVPINESLLYIKYQYGHVNNNRTNLNSVL